MLKKIKYHLIDKTAALYYEKMILILIAFVVGALLLAIFNAALDDTFKEKMTQLLSDLLSW